MPTLTYTDKDTVNMFFGQGKHSLLLILMIKTRQKAVQNEL